MILLGSFYGQFTFGQWIVISLAGMLVLGFIAAIGWLAEADEADSAADAWGGFIWGAFVYLFLLAALTLALVIIDLIVLLWNL